MSALQLITEVFKTGTSNLYPDEVIPQDAASDSLNWNTRDGIIQLIGGRQAQGAVGGVGKSYMEHTAYRADGTPVRFRKVNGTIQTLVGTTWTDVITGLTATADYVGANYQSLAGAFVYFFGVDGIYKIATANPTSYSAMYDAARNFKGFAIIDKARALLWGRKDDPTGLYGSWIDGQDATVYTTVAGEATGSGGGTLAFRAGHTTRTAFGVRITLTGTGEVFTDNFNGVLTGSLGGTGTIDYTTGIYTLSHTGTGTAGYQWEDSNQKGVTDFTHSAPRVAGEGFVIRQDAGGDAIQVVIPLDGSYFSLKVHSCYKFTLDTTDTAPTNDIFRTDIGVSSLRSAVGTGQGIMYMNTANPSKPSLGILKQNVLGDNFDATPLFIQYDFSPFDFSDCLLDTWDRYVIVGCKTIGNAENDTLLLGDVQAGTVDRTYYGIRTSTKENGLLYGGDPVSKTTYELFTGFDDMGNALQNYWIGKGETYGGKKSVGALGTTLKKLRFLRFQGKISPDQAIEVYVSTDEGDFALVGTILGSGAYVDYSTSFAIGTNDIGGAVVGGGIGATVYAFFLEIKVKTGKFRRRRVKFVAKGIGYASISMIVDFDILVFEDKMPARYRLKQNVSLDGTETDLPNPQF